MFLHPPVYVLALLLQIPNTRCICLHLCFLLLPWLKAYCARVASNLSMQRNTGAHICKTCGYDSALTGKQAKVCTGCRGVYYCDRACQKKDWSRHRQVCTQVKFIHLTVRKLSGCASGPHRCNDSDSVADLRAAVEGWVLAGETNEMILDFKFAYNGCVLRDLDTWRKAAVPDGAEIAVILYEDPLPPLRASSSSDEGPVATDLVESSSEDESKTFFSKVCASSIHEIERLEGNHVRRGYATQAYEIARCYDAQTRRPRLL